MSRTKVDVNAASKLYLIQVQFMSAALLINMVSILILLRISMHRGHVLVIFLNVYILYLNTHEMYFIWSHLFAESYASNSDISAPFGKWSCKFKFHDVLQKYHKRIISSHTRSKPYINHGIRYLYKNVHFHNNQPSFNDHHSPILRACELSQGSVFRRDQTGDGRC